MLVMFWCNKYEYKTIKNPNSMLKRLYSR